MEADIMLKITIGLADDDEKIHSSVDELLQRNFSNASVEHFYTTSALKKFLYDSPFALDLLLLDVIFEGGESGIQALPKIREYAPVLPITLLTAQENPDDFQSAYQFNVEYKPKPIKDSHMIIHIQTALHRKKEYEKLTTEIHDYSDYISFVEEDKRSLEDKLSEVVSMKIPSAFSDLVIAIFPDIEFSPNALIELLGRKIDERVFKVLKTVDWKLKPNKGMRIKPFQGKRDENIWEYRFSQTGRVLVKYQEGQKPKIVLIDYFHNSW